MWQADDEEEERRAAAQALATEHNEAAQRESDTQHASSRHLPFRPKTPRGFFVTVFMLMFSIVFGHAQGSMKELKAVMRAAHGNASAREAGQCNNIWVHTQNFAGLSAHLPAAQELLSRPATILLGQESHLTAEGEAAIKGRMPRYHLVFGAAGEAKRTTLPSSQGVNTKKAIALNYSGSRGVFAAATPDLAIQDSTKNSILAGELRDIVGWQEVYVPLPPDDQGERRFFVASAYFETNTDDSSEVNSKLAQQVTAAMKRKGRHIPYYLCGGFQGDWSATGLMDE